MRFHALNRLMQVRIELFSRGLDALHAMLREHFPELLADQLEAFAIFLIRRIVMRGERAIETIQHRKRIARSAAQRRAGLLRDVRAQSSCGNSRNRPGGGPSSSAILPSRPPALRCALRATPLSRRDRPQLLPAESFAILRLFRRFAIATFVFHDVPPLPMVSLNARATNATAVIARSYCMRMGPSTPTVPCD